ncbi:hypothetical protein [Motilimonas eburnea]|uniref:hypothetical protein n=1 Tax=Motilimonas eburnea TaxID=1737488 RepID=UPI001E2FB17B|nr:hypothetical protein [Motilimonas eburnea]MCE2570467.1 hypothetical protein [Motilimonas eburnea]
MAVFSALQDRIKSWLSPQDLIEPTQQAWIEQMMGVFSQYAQSHQFKAKLITPTVTDFPSKATSANELAQATLSQLQLYFGLSQQGFAIRPPVNYQTPYSAQLTEPMVVNSSHNVLTQPVYIDYHPGHLNNPNALVSVFAIQLCQWLMSSPLLAQGAGDAMREQATELLAISLGAGVMVVNSAFTFRGGGCGSCHNTKLGRQAMLSEAEACYALALFCYQNNIALAQVRPHLKPHLRGMLKQGHQQVLRFRAKPTPTVNRLSEN